MKKYMISAILAGTVFTVNSAAMPVEVTASNYWPLQTEQFISKYGLATENFIFDKASQLQMNYSLTQGQVSNMVKDAVGSNNPLVNGSIDVLSKCVENVTGKIGIPFELPDLGKVCGQDITTMIVNAVRDDVMSLHDTFKAWLLSKKTWVKTGDNEEKNKNFINEIQAKIICEKTIINKDGKVVDYPTLNLTVYKDKCIFINKDGQKIVIPRINDQEVMEDICKNADINGKNSDKFLFCKGRGYESGDNSIPQLNQKAMLGNTDDFGEELGKMPEIKDKYRRLAKNMEEIERNENTDEIRNLEARKITYESMFDSSYFNYDQNGQNGKIKPEFLKNNLMVDDIKNYPITIPVFNYIYEKPIVMDSGGSKTEGYALTSKQMGDLQNKKPMVADMSVPIITDSKELIAGANSDGFKDYDKGIDNFIKFSEKISGQKDSQLTKFLNKMKISQNLDKVKESKNNQTTFNFATLSQLGYVETLLAFKSVDGANGGEAAKYIGQSNLLKGLLYQMHLMNLQLYTYNRYNVATEYYHWLYLKERLLDIEKELKEIKIVNSVFLRKILEK